ncbi:MAG TPA: hypothetical protein DD490_35325 [Acidobacteria bacterium]|nr:hypothetical protein [Acidobacteriota bacterium]
MRPLRLALLLIPLLACRTTAPPAAGGRPDPPARRVILLSLDGAEAETLHRLWRQGALSKEGFGRFFKDGQVADHLVPVAPSLTAVNHISLATGFAPDGTGIVGNNFHPAGTPFLDVVSGFSAPIASETLWEAARRQGKRTAVLTWPGADGTDARRVGDWGLTYVGAPLLDPELVVLAPADWTPAEAHDPRLQGLRSFAPILVARLPQRGFEIAVLDRTDDRQTGYDTVVPLVAPPARAPLEVGQWGGVPCVGPWLEGEAELATTCLVKLLELAPDLATARIYLNDVSINEAYPEAFAREFAESGLLWPGPPDDGFLSAAWKGEPGIDLATWVEQSERFTGFFGAALRLAVARDDWDLLMGYFPTIDEAGHQLLLTDPRQELFTPQRRAECARARLRIWQAVDRELAAILRVADLRDTRVVLVSDHGMLPIHTALDPNVLLQEKGLLAADKAKILEEGTIVRAVTGGGSAHVYVREDAPDRARLLTELRDLFTGWTLPDGTRPIVRAVFREDAGEIGLRHPDSGDLILFSATGYGFSGAGLRKGTSVFPSPAAGMHGHLPGDPRLNSIYLALGAGLRKGNAGIVRNVDVAGRVAGWLGIEPPRLNPPEP